jgi:hypothetical protein
VNALYGLFEDAPAWMAAWPTGLASSAIEISALHWTRSAGRSRMKSDCRAVPRRPLRKSPSIVLGVNSTSFGRELNHSENFCARQKLWFLSTDGTRQSTDARHASASERGRSPRVERNVAKRFYASERARLIQDQAPMRDVDRESIRPDSIVAYFILQLLRGDFCNKIGVKQTLSIDGNDANDSEPTLTALAGCKMSRIFAA